MKKTMPFIIVLLIVLFAFLGVISINHNSEEMLTSVNTTKKIYLTTDKSTTEESTAKETTKTDGASVESAKYTHKEMNSILFEYAAKYSYDDSLTHNNVLAFSMQENGKGAALCTDSKKPDNDKNVRLYTTKDHGKKWEKLAGFDLNGIDSTLIYIGSDIIITCYNESLYGTYIRISHDDGNSFDIVSASSVLGYSEKEIPAVYPVILACDYESQSFILGWKDAKIKNTGFCLIEKYNTELEIVQDIFKDSDALKEIKVAKRSVSDLYYSDPEDEKSSSWTQDNIAEAISVLRNYALGKPVTDESKGKILHYSMLENGNGVAVYGEYGGMHHVYASLLSTTDFGNTWQVSKETFSYSSGESELVLIDDSVIFLNYNSVTFYPTVMISHDLGYKFKTIYLSDILGYKGTTPLSLYPKVKSVDEKAKTYTVDWINIHNGKVLLTQQYNTDFDAIKTIFHDKEAIEALMQYNEKSYF